MHLSTLLQALLQHEICLLECEITSIVYPYSFGIQMFDVMEYKIYVWELNRALHCNLFSLVTDL